MGVSGSSISKDENDESNIIHFQSMIQPKNLNDKKGICLDKRAIVIKRLSHQLLFENFLSEDLESLYLTSNQIKSIIYNSIDRTIEDNSIDRYSEQNFKLNVDSYIDLLIELNNNNIIDFMSIVSASLLMNYQSIESKIDSLFFYTTLDNNIDNLHFDEFYLAIKSFELGISNCLGFKNSAEGSIKIISTNWLSLADPNHRGSIDKNTVINKKDFFDFCFNRQHIVRKLLEILALSSCPTEEISNHIAEESIYKNINIPPKQPSSGGDEWLANPAWKKVAERMRPNNIKIENNLPNTSLVLNWVHGYRGFDCRNNIFFLSFDGKHVLFHTAALVVCQYTSDSIRKQSYFNMHTDDIIALAMSTHPSNNSQKLVASGQLGKNPIIYLSLWNLSVNQIDSHFDSLSCLKGFHTKGVTQLVFSKDSSRLFSIGVEYTVAVYNSDVTNISNIGRMIFSSQGPKDKVLHCCYIGSNNSFISCGEKHIILWSNQTSNYQQLNGKLGSEKSKLFLSVISLSDVSIAVGTSDGDIYVCKVAENKECILLPGPKSNLGIHPKGVNCLSTSKNKQFLVSGGKDCKVILWKVSEDQGISLINKVTELLIDNYSFRAINFSDDGNSIITSNINCDIVYNYLPNNTSYLSITDKVVSSGKISLVSGHCKDELWGMTIVPNSSIFITVGDDGLLKVWDMQNNILIVSYDLQLPSRCCTVSPDGTYLAIGFMSKSSNTKGKPKQSQGSVRIYRLEQLISNKTNQSTLSTNLILEIKDAKQSISCIKFSPDGTILTVGSRDNSIYHYSVIQQFKLKSKFSKHNAGILGFDFSICGKYLISYCSAYELLYSEVSTGNQITKAESLLKDMNWATGTCTLGWSVNGIWHDGMDGSDINSVDTTRNKTFIASGEDSGKICVYSYPALVEGGSQRLEYSGHSSHVTSVRWFSNKDMEYLISCGGNDKSIMVWMVVNNNTDANKAKKKDSNNESKASENIESNENFELPGGGDEFLAVKPWLGAIVPPTSWSNPDVSKLATYNAALSEVYALREKLQQCKNDNDYDKIYESLRQSTIIACQRTNEACTKDTCIQPPSEDLELEWIYGYRGYDTRNNTYLISKNSDLLIIYPAAGLVVISNSNIKKQRYFRGHTDDVLCLACDNRDNNYVIASGQIGKGNTYVWDPVNIKTLGTVNTKQKSVILLSFSSDGKYICSLGEDKTIVVSDWKANNILVTTQGDAATSFQLNCVVNQTSGVISFVNSGDKFVKVWTINGRNLTSSKISTSPASKPQAFLSCVSVDNKLIIGGEDGYIYVSNDCKVIQSKWLHHMNATSKQLSDLSSSKTKLGAITALSYNQNLGLLCSGSRDGSIYLWDMKNKNDITINDIYCYVKLDEINELQGLICKQVHSLSIHSNDSNEILVLVGTKGCDLFILQCKEGSKNNEVTLQNNRFICNGHYADELWGLSTHPLKPEFMTVGDDKTLRIFSLQQKKQLSILNLNNMARCCSYHPIDPSLIAVGFGGRVGRGKEAGGGMIRVYKYERFNELSSEFNKLIEKNDAKQWISDIKFSSDGLILVASSHDCKIYIYDVAISHDSKVAVDLKLRHIFAKHNSVVNHIDISIDGSFMQSNCSAYELLFCDLHTGKQITSATELKDVRWNNWTCPLGWPVQGIWSGSMDGSDVNAVDRSHTGHLLAVGDDNGNVSLYRYPCPLPNTGKVAYSGHSSHVMNVRWSIGDEYLLSCGGNDKCIFQWKHGMSLQTSNLTAETTEISDELSSEFKEPTGGDESGAIKPWLGAIKPPKFPPPINKSAPLINLNLQWVFGYSSSGVTGSGGNKMKVSNNVYYNVNGEIIYPAASLGIIQSTVLTHKKKNQKYFHGHDDDILCLAISHNKRFAATGQTASKTSKGKGSISIWDAVEGRILCQLVGCHLRGVSNLCFSNDDTQLLSVGLDDNNTHILWSDSQGNWSRADKVAEEKGDKGTLLFSCFLNPKNPLYQSNDCQIISGGSNNLNFWRLEGSKLTKKSGKWGKIKAPSAVLCCGNLLGKDSKYRLIVGSSTGDLLIYEENKEVVSVIEKAHNGPIVTLCEGIINNDVMYVITGGKDHVIKVWNQTLQSINSFDIMKYSLLDPSIVSLDYWSDVPTINMKNIIVGTSGGEIIQLNLTSEQSKTFNISESNISIEVYSHSAGELWGVCPHPINPEIVATVGDEGTLRIWNIGTTDDNFIMLGSVTLGWAARSVTWHPSGNIVAIGFMESVKGGVSAKSSKKKSKIATNSTQETITASTHNGAVHLYKVEIINNDVSFTKLCEGCTSSAWIQELRFSPDGSLLAVCSHDKHMYMYSIPISLTADDLSTCLNKVKYDYNKHSSAVLHIDFTSDGLYFQTNCQAGELLFGNVETGRQETSATKLANYNNIPGGDEENVEQGYWITQTCKLGWSVQGIFGTNIDLSDINSVDRHINQKVLATADDDGLVKIFRYPCIDSTSSFVSGTGHSSHVTNVRWTSTNQLVSVGGNDKCLFVWKMTDI